MTPEAKEFLEMDSLQAFEGAAQMLAALPEGPAKQAKMKKLQGAFNAVVQKYDLPPEVISPDTSLAKIAEFIPGVSYLPGLVRTAVGEGALAATGRNTFEGAKKRVIDAVVPDVPYFAEKGPAARGALSVGEYRNMLGQTGGKYDEPLIKSRPDLMSKGTALDFGLSVLLDPASIKGAKNMLSKKAGGANTIESLKKQFAAEIEAVKNRGTPGSILENTGKFMVDPIGTTGRALENWRFRDADYAAVDANQRPVSQVWREHGKPGFTDRGITLGKDKIISAENETVDKLLEQLPTGADLQARAKALYAKKWGQEAADKIPWDEVSEDTMLASLGIKGTRSEVMQPIYSPEIEAQARTEGLTEPTREAQKNITKQFEVTAMEDPSLVADFEEARRNAAPTKIRRDPKTGGVMVEENPLAAPAPTSILDFEEKYYTPDEMNRVKKSFQGIAAASRPNIYNAPDPAQQVLNRTEQRLAPLFQRAEGNLAADVGAKAGDMQHEMIASIAPEMGAQSFRSTKNMASVLKGGPFTSEPYTGINPLSTRMNRLRMGGNNPVGDLFLGTLAGGAEVGATAAGKAFSSPWSVYGAQPLLRGAVNEQAGRERQQSPWYMLNRDYMDIKR